jgi:hypothetical protein
MKTYISLRLGRAQVYCGMITWSVARQRLNKQVSATMDKHVIIKGTAGSGIFYEARAEDIQ